MGEPRRLRRVYRAGPTPGGTVMIDEILERKFTRIGARLKVNDPAGRGGAVRLDVRADRQGEFFEIRGGDHSEARVEVLDVQPADRHLLLLVREHGQKGKFL